MPVVTEGKETKQCLPNDKDRCMPQKRHYGIMEGMNYRRVWQT